MEDTNEEALIAIAATILSAFLGFAVAFWVWPWLGPQILSPCPQWTALGIGLYSMWMAFKCLGRLVFNRDLKKLERRVKRIELKGR